jgi:hypothetical protein
MAHRREPLIQFALRRKTGYISTYSLPSIYPSWATSVYFFRLGKNSTYSPLMIKVGSLAWAHIPAWMVRLPSWIARKVQNRDIGGFTKQPHREPYVMSWNRPDATATRAHALRAHKQRKSSS